MSREVGRWLGFWEWETPRRCAALRQHWVALPISIYTVFTKLIDKQW